MSPHLPERADPWQLCAKDRSFKGEIPLKALGRLTPLLASDAGAAAFVLAFGRDQKGRPLVEGRVAAALSLVCQRCLGTMPLAVAQEFRLRLVAGLDEAMALPDELDPLVVEDGQLNLRDIIEDELILAVPTTPRHRIAECPVRVETGAPLPGAAPERENPFAVLTALKRGEHDS